MVSILSGNTTEVEIDFGAGYSDQGQYVSSITVTRGRSRQLDQFNAGTAVVVLRNDDRRFDPSNTGSSTGFTLRPRRPIRITVASQRIFTGYIDDIDIAWDQHQIGTVTLSCIDNFSLLANQTLDEFAASEQLSSARFSAVLDRPEVDFDSGARDIGTGAATLAAATVPQGTNVLDYLQAVTVSEQGYFFAARDGDITFRGRTDILNTTSSVHLYDTEAGAGASNPVYVGWEAQYGTELLYNRVSTQRTGGTLYTANDSSSQSAYLIRTLSLLDLLYSSDGQAEDLGTFLLGKYAQPELRVANAEVLIRDNTSPYQSVLALDIGDTITVTKTYDSGSPTNPTPEKVAIEGIRHTITPSEHRVFLTFGTTDSRAFLVLDDSVLGRLDKNLLAF